MYACYIEHQGSTYVFKRNDKTGDRYWICHRRGTGKFVSGQIVPLFLASDLTKLAIKQGVSAKTFAPPKKHKPVSGGGGKTSRVKTKIPLFSLFENSDSTE